MKTEKTDKGVQRLATAMLLQAVQDAMSHSTGRRNGALRWILSKEQCPFSFAFVCRVVNRDPEEVREFCLRKIAERRAAEPVYRSVFAHLEGPFSVHAA